MTDLNENGLGTDEQSRFDALYGTQPAPTPAPTGPGVFRNAQAGLAGIPAGLAGGALATASYATDTNDVLGNTYADAIGYHGSMDDAPWNQQHRNIEQIRRETADFYRPDPTTTGFVGQTLYGLTDVLSRVVATNALLPGAGVAGAALTSGYERTADLEAEGVDQATAFGSGAITSGSLLAGGFGGTVGKTVALRVASGAGTNLAFGTGTRALDSALLQSNGYAAQAQQQKWNDAASISADLLIGGAFGFLPHGAERAHIPADAVDAALTRKESDSVAQAAPGVPVDARSSAAHADALDTAVGQMVDGQAVAVDHIVRDASFVDRGEPQGVEGEIRDSLVQDGVAPDDLGEVERSASEKHANDSLMARLNADPDQVFAEYAARPESEGGRVLNTDTARELAPEYISDRTRSADVHEAASETVKRLYAKKLAEPTPEGLHPTVLFTAGGTGAGKSTAIRGLSADIPSPEIVYDTNMNTYASAEKKVEQALDAGRKVSILYVYRDPVEALTGGALPRAERQRAEFGTGRTVPLSEHARTHLGVRDVIERLAEKYKGDERVQIQAYDNSRGRDAGRLADLADLPRPEENGLHERLKAALDEEHQAGRVSDATRAGFESPGRGPQGLQREAVPDARRESPQERQVTQRGAVDTSPGDAADGGLQDAGRPESGNPDANPEAQPRTGLDPARDAEVAVARQSVEEKPNLVLEDGTTAAEAMRAADDEVTQAERTGSGIQAAIACFLRFGEDAA